MPAPKTPLKYNAKELVAEQSGFFWTIVALIIVFGVGSSVRAILSPDKIKKRIQEVSTKIHPDVNVQFGDAYISLADGIFPEFALVIERVRLESANTCWMMPVLQVNQMKLPLSLSSLFKGRAEVNRLEVNEADLSFRSPYSACDASVSEAELIRNVAQRQPKSVVQENKNPIETVTVRVLKVNAVRFEKLEYQKQGSEGGFHIDGLLNLGAESLAGDFASFANLNVDFDPAREQHWTVGLNGNWREGTYRVSGDYNQTKKSVVMSGELKHLPLSQIFPVLKKYNVISQSLDGKSLWLSSRFSVQGLVTEPDDLFFALDDLKVEGDVGDVQATRIELESAKPLEFKPFTLQMRGIHLARVLNLLGKKHPSPALGELGRLSGDFKFDGKKTFDFDGDLTGLEFIFSNKGLRQSQVLSVVTLKWHQDAASSNLHVTRIRPLEGIFEGGIEVTTNASQETLIVAAVDELQFAPSVIRLMTQGGSVDPMQGKMRMRLQAGKIVDLIGDLRTGRMTVEGIEFLKPKVSFTLKKGGYRGTAEAEQVAAVPENKELQPFLPLLSSAPAPGELMAFKKVIFQFSSPLPQTMNWTGFKAQLQGRDISSSGGWDAQGLLNGKIQKKRDGGGVQSWSLFGTRDKVEVHEN